MQNTTATAVEIEAALLNQAQSGDHEAFSTLLGGCHGTLHGLVLRITKNHEDAEDAVQSAVLKAYAKLSQFQERARFSSWIARIAINEAFMKLRKQKRLKEVSLDDPLQTQEFAPRPPAIEKEHEDPEKAFRRAEVLEAMVRAVGSLPPMYQAAFFLTQVRGCTNQEAAKQLALPVSTIKSRVHRARKHVRNVLNPNGESLPC